METYKSDFALKSLNSDDGTFSGYGSVTGNVDSHGDIVERGAFKDAIDAANTSGDWPRMLLQHGIDSPLPIGIWTKIAEDENGLYLEGKLALDNSRGRDTYALMKMQPRPALNGLSIGYHALQFVKHPSTSKARRTLQRVKLVEVSVVVSPSNPLATVRRVKSSNLFRPVASRTDDAANNFLRKLAALDATRHPHH